MATDGQFYWPSVGTFVAAYGQFFMAANKHLTCRFILMIGRRGTAGVSSVEPLDGPQ